MTSNWDRFLRDEDQPEFARPKKPSRLVMVNNTTARHDQWSGRWVSGKKERVEIRRVLHRQSPDKHLRQGGLVVAHVTLDGLGNPLFELRTNNRLPFEALRELLECAEEAREFLEDEGE